MSKNIFLISDTHFGHSLMYEKPFLRPDGTPLRPWPSAEEADEAMIQRWNATVGPNDQTYVLGDFAMRAGRVAIAEKLNGIKVLCSGNHDIFGAKKYLQYFKDVRSYHMLDGFLLCHVPIHPDSLGKAIGNVHGHLHCRSVLQSNKIDARYFSVCVEQINYTPIAWEDIKTEFANRSNEN